MILPFVPQVTMTCVPARCGGAPCRRERFVAENIECVWRYHEEDVAGGLMWVTGRSFPALPTGWAGGFVNKEPHATEGLSISSMRVTLATATRTCPAPRQPDPR